MQVAPPALSLSLSFSLFVPSPLSNSGACHPRVYTYIVTTHIPLTKFSRVNPANTKYTLVVLVVVVLGLGSDARATRLEAPPTKGEPKYHDAAAGR